MAITGKVRVGDLLPEFLAHTLVFLGPLQPAGAIAAGTLQALLDRLYHFQIFVQSYSHDVHILFYLKLGGVSPALCVLNTGQFLQHGSKVCLLPGTVCHTEMAFRSSGCINGTAQLQLADNARRSHIAGLA